MLPPDHNLALFANRDCAGQVALNVHHAAFRQCQFGPTVAVDEHVGLLLEGLRRSEIALFPKSRSIQFSEGFLPIVHRIKEGHVAQERGTSDSEFDGFPAAGRSQFAVGRSRLGGLRILRECRHEPMKDGGHKKGSDQTG
jgi:hypothetical protein